ncbi:hypothetical protein BOH78_4319 [Pichia kudriavzevii]|uniref:Uncharacterized protein n=1 Tax=Pichia kudriavzevii TaxID=4909 RepID=A0A1V2LHJ4_PICKU|nr:hypothetical protein BOH78_4666 [Pichia kudriavzevii]ONH71731.1 hypothetical protein BOH78_4319 [Pichia kudriavzevii]
MSGLTLLVELQLKGLKKRTIQGLPIKVFQGGLRSTVVEMVHTSDFSVFHCIKKISRPKYVPEYEQKSRD